MRSLLDDPRLVGALFLFIRDEHPCLFRGQRLPAEQDFGKHHGRRALSNAVRAIENHPRWSVPAGVKPGNLCPGPVLPDHLTRRKGPEVHLLGITVPPSPGHHSTPSNWSATACKTRSRTVSRLPEASISATGPRSAASLRTCAYDARTRA